jgi:hypothetical protein
LPSHLHDGSYPTAPHRESRTEPRRQCRESSRIDLATAPPPPVAGGISPPNRPPRAYKRPCATPLAPRTSSTISSFPRALHRRRKRRPRPPPLTARRRPSIHPSSASRPKVSTGLRSPRFPLRFPLPWPPPTPGAPLPAAGRGRLCPSSVLDRGGGEGGGGGRRRVFCPYPLSSFPHRAPPPLYSLSLFLSIKTPTLKLFHQNNPALYK